MTPRPGEAVGPFTLVRLLGQGGMGAVFVARHANGVEFALKVLLDPDARALERFKREIAALGRVDRHPGVVRVHTAGTHGPEKSPYVVMDLVRGADLSKVIGGRPVEPRRAALLVAKVARAVEHCHAQGVLHRDLKPANVLVRAEDQEPLVTDFGLARQDTADRLTKTGELLGTPAYMAPEQLEGDRDAQDRRTDVYALGAILYECLTGDPPFKTDTQPRLIKMILIDDPKDPRRIVPAVPAELSVIALKCLAKERERRYGTAAELADELDRWLAGEPILARPETRAEKRRRWLKRNRTVVLLGALILVTALTAGGVLAYFAAQGGKRVFTKERDAALEAASAADYPVLPDGPAGESVVRALEKLRRVAGEDLKQDAVALALDRWERLARDPAKTLESAPPPGDDLLASLDSVAALRTASRGLLPAVRGRIDGAPRAMLAAHETGELTALVLAFDGLSPVAQTVWRRTFEEDATRAFPAWCRKHEGDKLDPLLERGGALAPSWTRIVSLATAADWEALSGAHPETAVRLARVVKLSGERLEPLAFALSARAAPLIVHDDGGKATRTERDQGFFLLRAVAALGAQASGEALKRLYDVAGDQLEAGMTDRLECFDLLVALGTTPDADFLISGAPGTKEDEMERDRNLARSAEEFLRRHPDDVLTKVVSAVAILEVALDIESLNRALKRAGEPGLAGEPWQPYFDRGGELLDKVGPLDGRARAFERFERGELYMRGALHRPGIKGGEAYNDPEQLRLAREAFLEAGAYDRPWAVAKWLAEIEMRTLKRWQAQAFSGPESERASVLVSAEETLAKLVLHAHDWSRVIEEVVAFQARYPQLADASSIEDQRRLTVLSNVYNLSLNTAIRSQPLDTQAEAHSIAGAIAVLAGDEAGKRRHAEAAVSALTRAIEIAPERPALQLDRAVHLIELGRLAEARADLELCLKANPVAGGLNAEQRHAAEETLKNLK